MNYVICYIFDLIPQMTPYPSLPDPASVVPKPEVQQLDPGGNCWLEVGRQAGWTSSAQHKKTFLDLADTQATMLCLKGWNCRQLHSHTHTHTNTYTETNKPGWQNQISNVTVDSAQTLKAQLQQKEKHISMIVARGVTMYQCKYWYCVNNTNMII